MTGFDTGFFFRLLDGVPRAVSVWEPVAAGDASAALSCITLFELDRAALRGTLDRTAVDVLLVDLPVLCRVVWLGEGEGPGRLHRAARLAHGNGLAMADALILSALIEAGATTVYTTDPDLARYDGPTEVVVLD